MGTAYLVARIAVYLLLGRIVLSRLKDTTRDVAFALLNVLGYYFIFVYGHDDHFRTAFWIYLPVVLVLFVFMHAFSQRSGALPWLAFFAPILCLILLRHFPVSHADSILHLFHLNFDFTVLGFFLGFSYLAFRCSHLVLEVRNGIVKNRLSGNTSATASSFPP
jgi:D-alanyl-lipoteichoic acid acyltransferase DltB (MBOAT superfamily)